MSPVPGPIHDLRCCFAIQILMQLTKGAVKFHPQAKVVLVVLMVVVQQNKLKFTVKRRETNLVQKFLKMEMLLSFCVFGDFSDGIVEVL